MKKILTSLLFLSLLTGCSNEGTKSASSEESIASSEKTESAAPESEESSSEVKEAITDLNQAGSIESNGEVMYTITVTDIKDVTEAASNELINDSNYLSYYSNDQAKQAVQVTLLMENKSGDVLGMPYLDDVKVIDSAGVTNLGGWKDEAGTKTEFGYYQLDESLEPIANIYTIQDQESRMATSTVLLANESEKIKFKFVSQMYRDSIDFELDIK